MTIDSIHWAELSQQIKGSLLTQHPLNRHNTWRVGGPGEAVLIPGSIEDIQTILKYIPSHYPLTWLGLGSNVLIQDKGIAGLVIITQGSVLDEIKIEDNVIYAQAGVPCGQLARFAARHDKAGLEFLAGIPGTVGGALAMNAGCYGSETWDYVTHVETIDRQGIRHVRQKNEFAISYRHVAFPATEYFLAAYFTVNDGNKAESLSRIKTMLDKRNLAQPTHLPNCGSVFKNPPGNHAATLIQACGLKGYQIGGAQISEKHANFIVNIDNSSSSDILNLIALAKERVKEKFDVLLEQEVKVIQ